MNKKSAAIAAGAIGLTAVGIWSAAFAPQKNLHDVSSTPSAQARPGARSTVGTSASADVPATSPAQVHGPQPMPFLEMVSAPFHAGNYNARVKTPSDDVLYVRVDAAQVDGKNSPFWKTGKEGRIPVTLPDGSAFSVVVNSTKSLGVSRFASVGEVENAPGSRALFAYNQGELSGLIESPQMGSWQLRAMGEGVSQWFKVDASRIPGCGIDAQALVAAKNKASSRKQSATTMGAALETDKDAGSGTVVAAVAGKFEIRILFAYTDAVARTVSAGALQSGFDLAILTLNNDLSRSQVDAAATFADSIQVSYAEDDVAAGSDKVQTNALDHLSELNDGKMDAVHPRRDQVEADLVCLVQLRDDSSSAGVGYLLDDPGSVYNPLLGFSVVQYSYLNSNSVFSHEIGHNLGCAHDRENAKDSDGKATTGAYAYSYGYRFKGADNIEYRTVMAYTPGTRLSYFSNPDITAPAPISRPVGIAAGQTGQADNARTIRNLAFEVGNYRLSTQNPVNPGRLVNVSTRAFVGTGFQQLIAGFVVSGNGSKRLLVRGIGPTLAQYGVTGVLADPVMRLVNGAGVQIATNDNWNSADSITMNGAGAFQLPSGSRDAVIVATLEPGNYTALIEGAGGGTGIALVEGYELEANSSRFANMSTRGYADKARPMVAGFVIHPDPARPGASKRVVIRVLGPTLKEDFSVADAMEDPILSLYDSSSRKILMNDDWSSGSTGGDTNPDVLIYAEQKIAAAGLSPGNRRDSAVMVDLSPGLYTVEVLPFEELPDQPQKPGIALVEVFEVNP